MTRKQKIIIILAVALALAGILFYFFFYQQSAPSGTQPESSPRTGFLPETLTRIFTRGGTQPRGSAQPTPISPADRKKQRLYRISHEPALAPSLTTDGSHVMYFTRKDGLLWQSDLEGLGQQRLDDKPIQNLVEADWSPNKHEVILTIVDPTDTPRKHLYSTVTKKSQPLDRNMQAVAFAPKGDRIIYHYQNSTNGNSAIAISKPDGTDFKTIFQPLFNDFALFWPKDDGAVLQTNPTYFTETAVYTLDTRVGTISKVLPVSVPGLSTLWSGDGNRYLASRTTADGNLQYAVSGGFRQSEQKNLFTLMTLAEKCVWKLDHITVVCGVPSEIPFDVKLPEDYYQGSFISADDVVEVNAISGVSRQIARSTELYPTLDVDTPIIGADQSRIFFLNRRDGYIYALRLAP